MTQLTNQTVYLDASAIIKLFLTEPLTSKVLTVIGKPNTVLLTSCLSCAAIHGVFARALNQGRITPAEQAELVEDFRNWFEDVCAIDVPWFRVNHASELAIKCNLRGIDAVHLATALEFTHGFYGRHVFVTYDKRLAEEAKATNQFDWVETDPVFNL